VALYRRRVARRFDVPAGDGVAVIIPVKGDAGQEHGYRI